MFNISSHQKEYIRNVKRMSNFTMHFFTFFFSRRGRATVFRRRRTTVFAVFEGWTFHFRGTVSAPLRVLRNSLRQAPLEQVLALEGDNRPLPCQRKGQRDGFSKKRTALRNSLQWGLEQVLGGGVS